MGDFLKNGVPILLTSVASYIIWRKHLTAKGENSSKVDDTSEEQSKTSINDHSLSLNVQDHLSELPNDVCLHILSLLSLRDVARLATLSRKLRNVCLLLPCLYLEWNEMSGMPKHLLHSEECKLYRATYVKNVDQVLKNYRDQKIFSLRLSCCLDNNHAVAVDRWIIVSAANKNLQSFFLQFSCLDYPIWSCKRNYKKLKSISWSRFSQFSSVRELHIHCCILKVENDVKLSNLATLDLKDVILEGTNWQDFLTGFSVIKCLYVRMCNLPSKLCIGEDFHHLSFLWMVDISDLKELELSSRNLTTFEFQSYFDAECSFINVPCLEKVGLHLKGLACRNVFLNLAANATNLKHLKLEGAANLIGKLPSPGSNIFKSALSFHMNMSAAGIIGKAIPRILNFFPFLTRLELKLPFEFSGEDYELSYLHENLKEVRLLRFHVEWIPVAAFFLRIASVLDRMVLSIPPKAGWGYESQCFSKNLLYQAVCFPDFRLSENQCSYIQNALMGKAISSTAQVIIQNQY